MTLSAKEYETVVIEHAKRAEQAAEKQMNWWRCNGGLSAARIKDGGDGYKVGYKDALRDLRLHKVI